MWFQQQEKNSHEHQGGAKVGLKAVVKVLNSQWNGCFRARISCWNRILWQSIIGVWGIWGWSVYGYIRHTKNNNDIKARRDSLDQHEHEKWLISPRPIVEMAANISLTSNTGKLKKMNNVLQKKKNNPGMDLWLHRLYFSMEYKESLSQRMTSWGLSFLAVLVCVCVH